MICAYTYKYTTEVLRNNHGGPAGGQGVTKAG